MQTLINHRMSNRACRLMAALAWHPKAHYGLLLLNREHRWRDVRVKTLGRGNG